MASVSPTHLLIFTKQFASMMRSNLQLVYVLEDLASETPQRKLSAALKDVVERLKQGADLADALLKWPQIFDSIYISIIRSGMQSGRLADALHQIVQYLERVNEARRKVRTAALYPCIIAFGFGIVFHIMMFLILPRFEAMFRKAGNDLPALTQGMMDIADWYAGHWQILLALAFGSTLLVAAAMRNRKGRLLWDKHRLHLPILGTVWRLNALARFSRTLSVQVGNHVAFVESVRLSGLASGNTFLAEVAHQIAREVEQGSNVAEAFRRRPIFSGVVVQMIASGEQSGNLDEMLLSAASYFENLLLQQIETATGLLSPLLTALVGGATAIMLIAVFLPIFDIAQAIH